MALVNTLNDASVARANRLLGVRSHEGWQDVMDIATRLVHDVMNTAVDFEGWDAQQITVLKGRAQGAKAIVDQLIIEINEAINLGIYVARTNEGENYEAVAQTDELRETILSHGEGRVAGSY